jgi:hypothetical protein
MDAGSHYQRDWAVYAAKYGKQVMVYWYNIGPGAVVGPDAYFICPPKLHGSRYVEAKSRIGAFVLPDVLIVHVNVGN